MALPAPLPACRPPRSSLAGVRALWLVGMTALGVVAAVSTPAQADGPQVRRGAWIVEGEYTGVVPSRCIAMNVALADRGGGAAAHKAGQSFDPNTTQSILVAYVESLGAIGFVVGVQLPGGTIWQTGDTVPVSLAVDGTPIELRVTTALDPTSVTLISQVPGRQPGGLLRAVEAGKRMEVEVAGRRHAFDLAEAKAAVALISQCAMNSGALPSNLVSDGTGGGDVAWSSVAPSEPSDADDIELEIEGDRQEAEASMRGPGAKSDALGQVLDTFGGTGAVPLAAFHCRFTGLDLLGMAGIDERSRPTEARFAVQGDGALLLNGTSVAPAQTKMGGSEVASAIYPAREVVQAIIGTPGPLPRGDRLGLAGAQAFAQSYLSQQVDTLLANRKRFMVVGVANGLVGFFELGSDGRASGQTASDCERLS